MSRIEKLLKAIINNTTYDEPRLSRIEEIFYSILYSLPYNANAQSRIEALLLALKESGLYDERTLSRIEEILKCKLDGSTYTGWIGSRVEMLLNEWELSEIIEATFTSFPIIIKANGDPLLDYTIYGNTVQSATPSPDSPIMPQGTGEKTENLFDKTITDGIILRMYINQSGQQVSSQNYYISYPLKVEGNAVYTWNFNSEYGATHNAPTVAFYDNNNNQIGVATHNNSILHFTFTTPNNCAYIRASVYVGKTTNTSMLLEGGVSVQDQTVIPFIPYGIKIPISSANTTTPVYLGEVQTTRKIYKMRLINPLSTTEASYGYRLLFSISSHRAPSYQYGGGRCNITKWNADYNKVGFVAAIQNVFITQNIAEWATLEGATAWLDEHEVYIWYVLAEPETGVVNEPLMKIGEYADTLSMEQAGVSIPTLNKPNNTVIDVETELKPSKMYVKYNGEGTRVYITSDGKLYITSNNEIYVLKR